MAKRKEKRESRHARKAGPRLRLPWKILLLVAVPATLLWWFLRSDPVPFDGAVQYSKITVIAEYPHDPDAFTQGLLWYDGYLFESTGRYGESTLRKVELRSGRVARRVDLLPSFFGEGLTRIGQRLIQITWQENTAFVYDVETLEQIDRVSYSGEGWGLCWNGRELIMSDGSDMLTFRDPETFEITKRQGVRLNGRPVSQLNELEWAHSSIYANIWYRDEIVRIHPSSGEVMEVMDASGLYRGRRLDGEDVLNGIAYKVDTDTFLLTGKLWPKVYEVSWE